MAENAKRDVLVGLTELQAHWRANGATEEEAARLRATVEQAYR